MAKFTAENAALFGSKGGKQTFAKHGAQHMARIGRKGFWATMDRHWRGDARAFVNYLIQLGIAATDPVPQNAAFEHDREAMRQRAKSGQASYLPRGWQPPSQLLPEDSGDATL